MSLANDVATAVLRGTDNLLVWLTAVALLAAVVWLYVDAAHRRSHGAVSRRSMTDDLPTARSMLHQDALCLFVWCSACHHQAPADLQAIIDVGGGGVPLKDLKFRCAECGSRLTDNVVMARDALAVQPWRRRDPDATALSDETGNVHNSKI